jgi:hypothetical protein
MADNIVHARAEHDDEIGLLEGGRAHRQEGQRMIVRYHAAPLRGRIKGNAGLLDQLLHLGPGARPNYAAAGDDHRLLGFGERHDECVDLLGITERTRMQDRPPTHGPVDLLLGHLGVENVAGKIEIGRSRLAAHGVLKCVVHLFGDAFQVQDAVGPLDAPFDDRNLVDLLEHLPTKLEDGARATDGHHWSAVDQRVGKAGCEIDDAGAARRHAHAGFLQ